MKEKEFNLSKFRVDDLRGGGQLGYREEDVKEFIKRVKEELKFILQYDEDINHVIDELAGDKLI